jgi:hypothetical protein
MVVADNSKTRAMITHVYFVWRCDSARVEDDSSVDLIQVNVRASTRDRQ